MVRKKETKARGNFRETISAEDGAYPNDGIKGNFWYVKKGLANTVPTHTLNTPNNQTLYENDTFKIDGSAKDPDVGDILNVYYRINGGTSRAIATGISTGAAILFNEQLTFKGGVLYKGATGIKCFTGMLSM